MTNHNTNGKILMIKYVIKKWKFGEGIPVPCMNNENQY